MSPEKIPYVEIYTDGSCLMNPGGAGGYGVILKYGDHIKELSGGLPDTTNNQMELLGVIAGLSALKRKCDVKIITDSRYIVDAFNKGWIDNWVNNQFKNIKNEEYWRKILELKYQHNSITFEWVKGHAGHPENERCDQLARSAAHKFLSV